MCELRIYFFRTQDFNKLSYSIFSFGSRFFVYLSEFVATTSYGDILLPNVLYPSVEIVKMQELSVRENYNRSS
jgi:hypothetical protein